MVSIRELSRAADQTGDAQNDLQITALHRAAYHGALEKVKTLLRQGADVNVADVYGWTPLHDAALRGELEIAVLLIQAGAEINAQDCEEKYTPLHDAARKNHAELVTILLQAGASTNILDKEKLTPLGSALKYAQKEAAAVLQKHMGLTL